MIRVLCTLAGSVSAQDPPCPPPELCSFPSFMSTGRSSYFLFPTRIHSQPFLHTLVKFLTPAPATMAHSLYVLGDLSQ